MTLLAGQIMAAAYFTTIPLEPNEKAKFFTIFVRVLKTLCEGFRTFLYVVVKSEQNKIMHTPRYTNVCKFFNFQLTFSQLILHLEC